MTWPLMPNITRKAKVVDVEVMLANRISATHSARFVRDQQMLRVAAEAIEVSAPMQRPDESLK